MESSNEKNGETVQSTNTVLDIGDEKPTVTTVSKRQEKRLNSYVQRKQLRRQIRKAYKDRRKLRRQLLKQSGVSETDSSSTNEVISRKALQRAPPMSASSCTTKVVIDCAYDHLMSFKDLCKLANQICGCYAVNRRSLRPVQLYVTGLGSSPQCVRSDSQTPSPQNPAGTRLMDRLRVAGCEHWDINLREEDYTDLFTADSIVYLCAESPHCLPDRFSDLTNPEDRTQFSTNDVYVIGGLVDHNHHIGYCYKQAIARGHRTARLPIVESGMLLNGRQVLSTVQVFEALAPLLAGLMTWAESLNAAIPLRKTVRPAIEQ